MDVHIYFYKISSVRLVLIKSRLNYRWARIESHDQSSMKTPRPRHSTAHVGPRHAGCVRPEPINAIGAERVFDFDSLVPILSYRYGLCWAWLGRSPAIGNPIHIVQFYDQNKLSIVDGETGKSSGPRLHPVTPCEMSSNDDYIAYCPPRLTRPSSVLSCSVVVGGDGGVVSVVSNSTTTASRSVYGTGCETPRGQITFRCAG